jgi:predicted trehalose synthase
MPALQSLGGVWLEWISAMFLKGYCGGMGQNSVLASSDDSARLLLDTFLLERALEEIQERLRDQPEWVQSPIQLLLRILEASSSA